MAIMTFQQTKSFSEPWFLFILAAIQFTHILDFMIIMPRGPVFMSDFKIDAHQFGWLVSSYTFGAALMAVLGTTFLSFVWLASYGLSSCFAWRIS